MIRLTDKVRRYNRKLRDLGLKDHQVERATTQRKLRNLLLLIYRSNLLLAWAILALPGVITHAPIFIPAKMYSKVKAKGIYLGACVYFCKCADFQWSYRGSCRIQCQDRREGRDRDLENPLLARCYSSSLHHLCHPGYLACLAKRGIVHGRQVDACPDFHHHAILCDEFAQVWRGRYGRLQVSTSLPVCIKSHRLSFFPADHYDHSSFPCYPEVKRNSKNCAKPENRSPTSCPR